MNYPLFTDNILPEFNFNPSFINLFIKKDNDKNYIYKVRGIKNDYSEEVDVDILIEFPI